MKIKYGALCLMLSVVMIASAVPVTALGNTGVESPVQQFVASTPGTDFVLPVTPQTTVPTGFKGIYTKADLNNIRNDLSGNYILMNDIVFTETDFQVGGGYYNGGWGWNPIGNYSSNQPFTGEFDGNGKSISGLRFNLFLMSSPESCVSAGLFSYVSGLVVNLSMTNADFKVEVMTPNQIAVGAIAGVNEGIVNNCVVTGKTGTPNTIASAGGLIGMNLATIAFCKNYVAVSSNQYAGGICGGSDGVIYDSVNSGTILAAHVNGFAGGIAGINTSTLTECFNTGAVKGMDKAGGIAGENTGEISNCFNTGRVETTSLTSRVGGIIGNNSGTLSYSYSDALVINSGNAQYLGGIVGGGSGIIAKCFYNYGVKSNALGTSLTRTQMKTQSSYEFFDFSSIWLMDTGIKRPVLRSVQPTKYAITYVLNGGRLAAGEPTSYMMGSNNILPIPTRMGFTYRGWYKSSTFTGTAVKTIPATTTGALTYYAKWTVPILSAASYNYTSIKVSWAAADGATSYKIYRATSANGTYYRVYIAPSTARSWIDTGQTTGKYYFYKVCPVAGGKSYYHTTYKYAKAVPARPTVTLSKASSTSIKVSWTGVSGATKYQIFRASSATGTYTYQYTASSTARSWVNTGRTPGKYYYYKVRAYHLEGTTKVYGASSAVKYLKI